MNRLTPEERRRLYRTQRQARESVARLSAPPTPAPDLRAHERGRTRLLTAVGIATVLGAVVLASMTLEFHPPTSLMEALLPRV